MFKENLKEMFVVFNIENNDRFNIYYKRLKSSGIDGLLIQQRIDSLILSWQPKYGNKIPSLPEIIGNDIETQKNSEIENAWMFFCKTCCYNFRHKPMEDWVYTMKRHLGTQEVEDMNGESEKWIKKEFFKIYPSIKSGGIHLLQEPVQYVIEGSMTKCIPSTESIETTKSVGEVIATTTKQIIPQKLK